MNKTELKLDGELRFIMRDNKRILQQLWLEVEQLNQNYVNIREFIWIDVPLVEDVT